MTTINRRQMIANMAVIGTASVPTVKYASSSEEHEKWYFDIELQSWVNPAMDLSLSPQTVYDRQIRFTGPDEIDDFDPYYKLIESVGKGPLGWYKNGEWIPRKPPKT